MWREHLRIWFPKPHHRNEWRHDESFSDSTEFTLAGEEAECITPATQTWRRQYVEEKQVGQTTTLRGVPTKAVVVVPSAFVVTGRGYQGWQPATNGSTPPVRRLAALTRLRQTCPLLTALCGVSRTTSFSMTHSRSVAPCSTLKTRLHSWADRPIRYCTLSCSTPSTPSLGFCEKIPFKTTLHWFGFQAEWLIGLECDLVWVVNGLIQIHKVLCFYICQVCLRKIKGEVWALKWKIKGNSVHCTHTLWFLVMHCCSLTGQRNTRNKWSMKEKKCYLPSSHWHCQKCGIENCIKTQIPFVACHHARRRFYCETG